MNKKYFVIVFLVFLLPLFFLTGCSSSNEKKAAYSDNEFIMNLAKGLEARWDISDKNEGKDDTVQVMKDYIQAELSQIEKYTSATFKDSVLQEKAIKYINLLKSSKENINNYFASDNEKWQEIFDQRAILLKDFVDNYKLKVNSKHQSKLDLLVSNGKTVAENASKETELKKLIKTLKFKKTKDEYGLQTYEAVLENTTPYNIKNLFLDISLLDKNGVIVSTEYASVENVSIGKKARVKFDTTDKFDKYEVVLSSYDLN